MTANRPEFDQRIADWLELDPTTAPPEVLSTVAAALPSIPQARRGLLAPRRLTLMNGTMRLAAAVVVAVLAIGGGIYLLGPGGGAGGGPPTPSPAPTADPSPGDLPVSFTSPLYGYSVDVPAGWSDVGPATVPWPDGGVSDATHPEWFDVFIYEPAGQDVGFIGVAAQPIPDEMTEDEWMRRYADVFAATDYVCNGPADAWVEAAVGTRAIRRIDVICDGRMPNDELVTGLRSAEVVFVVDGTGFLMSGNPEGIDTLLGSFQPG